MILVNIFAILNILVLSIFLLGKKNNPLPNKILAIILIIPGLNFLSNINLLSNEVFNIPFFFFLVQGTAALFGPFLYYYVNIICNQKLKLFNPLFFITLLILVFDVFIAINFFSLDEENRKIYLQSIIDGVYPQDMEYYNTILFAHQLIYLTSSALLIKKLKKNALDAISNFSGTGIKYMQHFVIMCWILTLITVLLYLSPVETKYVEYIYLPIVLIIIFYFIIIYGLNHNFIFSENSYQVFLNKDYTKINLDNESNSNTVLNESELIETFNFLDQYLKENELYLNSDLNLYSLSLETKISAKKISSCINKIASKNFFDYVNDLRIEKAIYFLKVKNNYSIDAIATEAGFNSRSAFYRAFKKYSGQTPTEYIKTKLSLVN